MKISYPDSLNPSVATKALPFFEEIISLCNDNLHSIYLVGSAITDDYLADKSDINSLLILSNIDFTLLEALWQLGKRHRKRGIAAPLCMTPDYIRESLDVFPIEFLDFKLLHIVVYGEDLIGNLEIKKEHLRLQCEREIKSRLINLRQGFISSLGEDRHLMQILIESVNGVAPLLRAILTLIGKTPPLNKAEVFSAFQEGFNFSSSDTFTKMLWLKQGKLKVKGSDLVALYRDFYLQIETIGNVLNSL